MTPKQTSGISPRERLRRLADVFAVEVRLRIVTSLYRRTLSPTQFYDEFGGGSVSRVNRNFERLDESGWLRYVFSKGPGGARRGGVEHFYRATELPYFDIETWALVPQSMRIACSWGLFRQIAKKLRMSLEAVGWKPGSGHRLDCIELQLDQVGWKRVIGAANALFDTVFEEQEDSRIRASDSKEKLISMDVLLVIFESLLVVRSRMASSLVEMAKEPLIPFFERLAPVFADDICLQIVSELNRRPMSVTQFHREFGGASISGIRSRFKRLERAGWLKRVGSETGGRRRGATEHFYMATKPALVDDEAWSEPPESSTEMRSWKTFSRFCQRALESMQSGVFDARLDRFVTLSFLELDHEGVANVTSQLESFASLLSEEQARAKTATDGSEDLIGVTVGLAAIEAPPELAKEP